MSMASATPMSDLASWLLEQIAEDERKARAAHCDRTEIDRLSRQPVRTVKDDGVWTVGEHAMDECEVEGIGIHVYGEGGHTHEQAEHIATWDPARVLAECEAKRRIIDWHRGGHYCTDLGNMESWYLREEPCPTLRALALPVADRPGYLEEWRP